MFNGYLAIDAVEVINIARTADYIKQFLPGTDMLCTDDVEALRSARGAGAYIDISAAPWFRDARHASGNFYGFWPISVTGAEDATRSIEVEELMGEGAVQSAPRHGSREIRFVVWAIAGDEESLSYGISWLKDVLNDNCLDNGGLGCFDRVVQMYLSMPTEETAADRMRTYVRVQTLESVKLMKQIPSKTARIMQLEFTLSTGSPWMFTNPYRVISDMSMTAFLTSHTDPAGEDCSQVDVSYNDYIDDPYYTAISRPPRPVVIKPPQLADIDTWWRRTVQIPDHQSDRPGQMVPVLAISTSTNDLRQLRIRFYPSSGSLSGCGYVGEFLVAYLPTNSTMILDGRRREASVIRNGKRVPGAHLLFGSDGRPFVWPVMSCHAEYTMVADIMSGNTGIAIDFDISVRE